MIFVPNYLDLDIPRIPLVYVHTFKYIPRQGGTEPGINMYGVTREYRSNNMRKGLIVPLDRIWRPVELIPKFYNHCNESWTYDSAVELSKEFYLNCFSDKATYIEVY